MMPAAKHFDPVLGIDIHIIQPPGPVPPLPVPHPFIGFIMDPMDYLPIIGSTVNINGLPRALAGTQGVCVPPHIPIGGVFVKPPANECEMFMGSATLNVDGDALSYLGLPALSCHCIGMPPIPRLRKKGAIKSLVLPTSNVLPIPAGPPVMVFGPPTISLMAMAMKLGMSALGTAFKKFMKTKAGKAIGKKVDDVKNKFKKKTPPHNKACGRAGEPVDVVTGANVDDFIDLDHPLFPGLVWQRFYSSLHHDQQGPMGFGFRHLWQHELQFRSDRVEYRLPDGDVVEMPLPEAFVSDLDSLNDSVVFRSQANGYRLSGHPQTSWQIEGAHAPTLQFSPERRGVCQLQSIRSSISTVELQYDDRGRMVGGRTQEGNGLHFELDQEGRICEITLVQSIEKETVCVYQYDPAGNLIRWTDALGKFSQYEYDERRRMTRKVDRNGYAYFYEYDEVGRCVRTFGQDGLYDVRLEYFPDEQLTQTVYADGAETLYSYDESGAITKIVDPTGGVTLFEFNEAGDVGQQIDANGDVNTYVYDDSGANLGRIDASGQALLPFDLQPHRPDGLAYQLPSSAEGWIAGDLSVIDRNQAGILSAQLSTIQSAPIKIKTPSERFVRPEQDYDLLGRLIQRRNVATKRASMQAFDPNGNLTSQVDEDGSRWNYRYSSWNLLEEQRDPVGNTIHYQYNLRQAITQVRDGGGTETAYDLDACDRMSAVHRGGKIRDRYVYDSCGGLIGKYDCNGDCLLQLEPGPYDTHAAIQLKDGPRIEYKHDAWARVVGATDGSCRLVRRYDPSGRLIADLINGHGVERKKLPNGRENVSVLKRFTSHYETLADGGVRMVDPTGQDHVLRRDTLGRFALASSNGIKQWMAFDDQGHLLSQYVGGLSEGDWWRTYEYSAAGDLQRIEDSKTGRIEYRFDAAHRLISQVDARGREQPFVHDSADNLLVQPGLAGVQIGAANQLNRTAEEQFEYNVRMHIAKRTHIDGTVTEYFYDALDRLTEIRRSDGLRWNAEYDPLGRRIAKQWVAPDGSEHRVDFYWDDHRLAGELHGGKKLRLYLYADDVAMTPILIAEYDSPEAELESGKVYHVLHDQRGQPIDIRDSAGKSVWQAVVAPFGGVQLSQASDFPMPLRMPGHYEDVECQLFYNRNRYFDCILGRYIQSDPLGLAGGNNTFAYPSNPLTHVDLQGLHPDSSSTSTPRSTVAEGKPKIHEGKQGKHVPGHNNFQPGKSELTHPDPQGLINRRAGTGVKHGPNKEVVDFQEPIGFHVDPDTGVKTPTSRGTIHTDNKGQAHIVPAKPDPVVGGS